MFWIILGALALAALFAFVMFLFFYGQTVQEEASTSSGSGSAGHSPAPDYRDRLKMATKRKRAGDLDAAADLIGDVLSEWEDNPPTYRNDYSPDGVGRDYPEAKVYTRWALYLQRADRPEEAERVFRMLIAGEYPYMKWTEKHYRELPARSPGEVGHEDERVAETRYRELAHIYDKYRLFLQREDRQNEMVLPLLLGMGAGMLGFHLAALDSDQVKLTLEYTDFQEEASETVASATEGTAFEDRAGELEAAVSEWVSELPETDLDTLEGSVRRVLGEGT